MGMTEEERRRCCLLGGCGCPPGGEAQRAALRTWLLENFRHEAAELEGDFEAYVDLKMAELPWGVIAEGGGAVLGDEPVTVDLEPTGLGDPEG